MMIESLREACDVMVEVSRLRDNNTAIGKLNADLKDLKMTADRLKNLAEVLQAIQNSGVVSAILTKDQLDDLNRWINTCGEKTSNYSLSSADVSALKSVLNTCQVSAEQIWKASAAEKANGAYNSLNSLKELLPNRTNTEDLLRRLASSKSGLPKSSRAVNEFVSDVQSAQQLVSRLKLDKEIEAFIGKVLTQKATLTDLNPHILDWIKSNHLTDKLKIRF